MSKSVYFNKEATDSLVKGLNLVSSAVKSTLGPAGTTVVIAREDKTPIITKDGVSVAKEIQPKDEKIKLGSELALAVAQKQLDSVGDGTTTSTVLASAIVNAGIRQIELSEFPVNRTALRKGIEKARDFIISELDGMKQNVKDEKDLINIAVVSANGDEKMGKVVADAYQKVGKAGVVLVEETKDRDIALDFKEGMTFNKGWTSQFFVNNHTDQSVEFDDPKILLCESKISNFTTLANLIQPIAQTGKPVVIIAESFDSSVTQALAMNILRTQGQLKVACVEAPGYGDRRLDLLRDMGIYLGASVANDPLGTKLDVMSAADLGSCEKIIIRKDETVIRGGKGDPEKIAERVKAITGVLEATPTKDQFEREQLGKRLAALTTGIAVIRVGGSSEEEIHESKDRIDDASWAVKAALEDGYLPGAGNTLLFLSERLENNVNAENSSEALGIKIFSTALKAPFKTIIENAGLPVDLIVKEVCDKADYKIGYDARTLKVVDLFEAGIIDPTKVVKGTVYAASSIASVILTSNVIITIDPKEDKGLSFNMMPGGIM